MKNAVNWFEIYTSDFGRAKKFYTDVFKCTLTDLPVSNDRHSQMEYAIFTGDEQAPNARGALVKLDVAPPGIGGTLVYFDTIDIEHTLSRVEGAGGKVIRPKQNIGEYGFIALIEDSEGNMIGLRSEE